MVLKKYSATQIETAFEVNTHESNEGAPPRLGMVRLGSVRLGFLSLPLHETRRGVVHFKSFYGSWIRILINYKRLLFIW